MALIRWQNLLFALLPGLDALRARSCAAAATGDTRDAARRARRQRRVPRLRSSSAFLPQMLAWKAMYGSFIARSPVGPQIRWTDPHLVDILWSARNGLFSTAPILYLGAHRPRRRSRSRGRRSACRCSLSVAVMIYFNACIQDWWGSAGFGGRRFDGSIPLFCARARRVRRLTRPAWCGGTRPPPSSRCSRVLAVWNAALMGAAQSGAVRIGETLSFDRAWAAQARVVHGWFGNPFTYPASLFFALRNGVSPGDYDLLSTNRFLADPLQPYGRVDVGMRTRTGRVADRRRLARAGDGRRGTFRWAASPATLRIPLDHAAPLRVQVRAARVRVSGRAAADADAVASTVSLRPAGSCAPLPVTPDWQTSSARWTRAALAGGRERAGAAVRLRAAPDRRRRRRRYAAACGGDGLDRCQ